MKLTPEGIAIIEDDTHLSKWIREQRTLEVAKSYCNLFRQYIPVGGAVIDVGACLGDMTATFSHMVGPNGLVVAFEPNPVAHECLLHNMIPYKNVTVYNFGLGDKDQKVGTFHDEISQFNLGATQLRGEGPIEVTKLDRFSFSKRINLIKIDAEGWEPRIIRGAMGLIQMDTPTILFEINRPVLKAQGSSVEEIYKLFDLLRYKVMPAESHHSLDSEQVDALAVPI